jgi:hypothetical protein
MSSHPSVTPIKKMQSNIRPVAHFHQAMRLSDSGHVSCSNSMTSRSEDNCSERLISMTVQHKEKSPRVHARTVSFQRFETCHALLQNQYRRIDSTDVGMHLAGNS